MFPRAPVARSIRRMSPFATGAIRLVPVGAKHRRASSVLMVAVQPPISLPLPVRFPSVSARPSGIDHRMGGFFCVSQIGP